MDRHLYSNSLSGHTPVFFCSNGIGPEYCPTLTRYRVIRFVPLCPSLAFANSLLLGLPNQGHYVPIYPQ